MGSVTFSQTKFPTDTDWNYMKHPGDFDDDNTLNSPHGKQLMILEFDILGFRTRPHYVLVL